MPISSPTLLIAHRGESRDAPENTLAAVNLAWSRGARAVEIDVRSSADGRPVVIHDASTRRIGGPAKAVAAQTADQLRRLDAGLWKGRRWAGERIPFLEEVLETIPAGGRLFIELKEGPESARVVSDVLRARAFDPRQLLLMSFNEETVQHLSLARLGIDVCLLLEAKQWKRRGGLARAVQVAHEFGLAGLNLEVDRALNEAVIRGVHDARLAIHCWTVNRVSTARRLARAGIDGITTDRCAWMTRHLGAAAE